MNLEKAKQLAQEHWNYLEQLLLTHNIPVEQINIIGFHYKTAFIHGYKHSQEDCEDAKKSTFQVD